jgi:urease accessory protein
LEDVAQSVATRTATGSAGRGHLGFARVDGATSLVRCGARSPLRILVPRHRDRSAWAFLSTFGGGLVAGDRIDIAIDVGPGAVAMVSTQAETKVYRSARGSDCAQVLRARVARGGSLLLMPDPVSLFAGARYSQRQHFDIDEGASLLYVDALVAGRTARGERWAFDDYRSRTEVTIGGALVLGDALLLGPRADAPLTERMGRYEAVAVAGFFGPAFAGAAAAMLARHAKAGVEVGAPALASVSSVGDGALLRAAATTTEHLARFLRESLSFVTELLGADPFQHRW